MNQKLTTIFSKWCCRTEDTLFSILLKLPVESFPAPVAKRIENYIDKRIRHIQQENIKSIWKAVQLEATLQEMKKAPANE